MTNQSQHSHVPPPAQDAHQISSLPMKLQPCKDVQPAPIHDDSQNQTQNIRQSSTIPEAVARYVDGPIMDNIVHPLIFDKPGPEYQPPPQACQDAHLASLDKVLNSGISQQSQDDAPDLQVVHLHTLDGQPAPSLKVEHLPTLDEQPAHSQADTLTNKARQSPTKPGAVARYVGGPILDINVQPLTLYTPGKTEVQPVTAGQPEVPISPPHSLMQKPTCLTRQKPAQPMVSEPPKQITRPQGPPHS